MLDTEIHIGLEKKEIRDFIGSEITGCWQAQSSAEIQEQIAAILRKELELARRKEALILLMELFGWEEYDVADDVTRSREESVYCIEFIGTEDEYNRLMSRFSPY